MLDTTLLLKEILNAADSYLQNPSIPVLPMSGYEEYLRTGNRMDFEKKYFARRRQLIVLALAYPQKKAVKPLLEQLLWEICNEYTWALPAHLPIEGQQFTIESEVWLDLFAAETGQALAEVLENVGEELSPMLVNRIRQELQRRIFQPFLAHVWDWEDKTNNWSAVVGGSIGLAALSVLPKNSEQQKRIIRRLAHSMQSYLAGFGEDGACLEGIGYWSYGFGYFIYYVEKLAEITGDDYYLKLEKVKRMAAFPYYMQYANEDFVPFSDYSQVAVPSGLLSFCKQHMQVPIPKFSQLTSLDFDYCYRFAHVSRNLKWYENTEETSLEPFNQYFADAQWWLVREEGMFFAAKGGNNQESHNHLDIGQFVFGDKELFLTDLGAGAYSRDYFTAKTRYRFFPPSAESHSVPQINNQWELPGSVSATDVQQQGKTFSMELSGIYPKATVSSFQRQFHVQGRTLIIDDHFVFDKQANTVVENFITRHLPIVEETTVTLEGETECCTLSFSTTQITIVPKKYQDHYGNQQTVYLIQAGYSFEQIEMKIKILIQLQTKPTGKKSLEGEDDAMLSMLSKR